MSKLVNKNKIFSPVDTRDYNLDTVGVGLVELPEEFIPEKKKLDCGIGWVLVSVIMQLPG